MNAIAPGWLGETFPTPTAAMSKGSSNKALTRVDGRSRLRNRLDYWVERDGKNGRLNPEFVEWIMLAHRVDRLKALGNGQVPRVAAAAFALLAEIG